MLNARNQFKGTIKTIKLGQVMAEVIISVSDLEVEPGYARPHVRNT